MLTFHFLSRLKTGSYNIFTIASIAVAEKRPLSYCGFQTLPLTMRYGAKIENNSGSNGRIFTPNELHFTFWFSDYDANFHQN